MLATEILEVQIEIREEILNGSYKVVDVGVVAILVNTLMTLT